MQSRSQYSEFAGTVALSPFSLKMETVSGASTIVEYGA
jgi:hypothetical protein